VYSQSESKNFSQYFSSACKFLNEILHNLLNDKTYILSSTVVEISENDQFIQI